MAEDVVRVKVTIPRELTSTNLTYGLVVEASRLQHDRCEL